LFLPRLDELCATNEIPMRAIKRDSVARLGVPLVEATAALLLRGKALYLDADPVHFNAEGNAIVARKIVKSTRPLP